MVPKSKLVAVSFSNSAEKRRNCIRWGPTDTPADCCSNDRGRATSIKQEGKKNRGTHFSNEIGITEKRTPTQRRRKDSVNV